MSCSKAQNSDFAGGETQTSNLYPQSDTLPTEPLHPTQFDGIDSLSRDVKIGSCMVISISVVLSF